MVVAEKLGKTLTELREGMTAAELWLWHAFYNLQNEQQQEAMKKQAEGAGRLELSAFFLWLLHRSIFPSR